LCFKLNLHYNSGKPQSDIIIKNKKNSMPKKDRTGKILIVRKKEAQTSFMKIFALMIPNLS
jgi:hypothetical protein